MTEQQARASCRQKCLTCARLYGDGKVGAYNYDKSGSGWCRCYSLQQHAQIDVASNSGWNYCWNMTSAWDEESTRPIPFTHSVACQHVSQCNAVTRTEFPLVLKSNKQNNKKRTRADEQCTPGVSQNWWKEHSAKNLMGYPGVICDTYIKESK